MTGSAEAQSATAGQRGRFSIALEGGSVNYLTSSGPYGGYSGGLAIRVEVARGVGFGTGIRYANGRYLKSWGAVEGYGTIFVAPSLGVWCPRLSGEIGISSVSRLYPPANTPVEQDYYARAEPGSVYAGVDLSPLRFQFAHFAFSLASIGIGVPFPTAESLRLNLRYAEIEWRF